MKTDPVCGMKIESNKSENTIYKGIKYYFCSQNCQERFIERPSEYIGHEPEKKLL